jgi:hypothetical protein
VGRNLAVLSFSIYIFFKRFVAVANPRAAPPNLSAPEYFVTRVVLLLAHDPTIT